MGDGRVAQALFPRGAVMLKTADALLILESGKMRNPNKLIPCGRHVPSGIKRRSLGLNSCDFSEVLVG